MGVDECMMDEDVIVSCPGLLGPPNGILGLFLPLYRDLRIKVSSSINTRSVNSAEKIFDDIAPDDRQAKSTIIMFSISYHGYAIATRVLKLIKQR